MKKTVALLLALCLLLTGCAGKSAASEDDWDFVFTDDLGRTVVLNRPQRVAALLGSFAQIWLLAGGKVIATADDAWDDLGLTLPADTVNLGNTKQLSLEALLAAKPDFILASTNTRQNLQWQEPLEASGIPVAYFDVSDFEDYLRLLDLFTDITGEKDCYRQYGTEVAEQIQTVMDRADPEGPTVLSLVASASAVYAKSSRGNVMGTMLKNLNCVNIADSEETLLENLSMEYILQADPEYIFIVQRGDDEEGMRRYVEDVLMGHPAWARLTAVQEGRIYFMEKNLYNLKPNHRWGEAYEKLEGILKNG